VTSKLEDIIFQHIEQKAVSRLHYIIELLRYRERTNSAVPSSSHLASAKNGGREGGALHNRLPDGQQQSMVATVPAASCAALDLGLGIAAMGLETVQGIAGNVPLFAHLNSVKRAFLDQHKDP